MTARLRPGLLPATVALLGATAAVTLTPAAAAAQELACTFRAPREELDDRKSPPDSASLRLDSGALKVCFGAPRARGRTIFGGLVPYGQSWRLGANEATVLHLSAPASVGDVRVNAGTYSLYTVPGKEEWRVVVNSAADRWGVPIDEGVKEKDVGAFTVEAGRTDDFVEALDLTLERTGPDSAELVIRWERTRVAVPIRLSPSSG